MWKVVFLHLNRRAEDTSDTGWLIVIPILGCNHPELSRHYDPNLATFLPTLADMAVYR